MPKGKKITTWEKYDQSIVIRVTEDGSFWPWMADGTVCGEPQETLHAVFQDLEEKFGPPQMVNLDWQHFVYVSVSHNLSSSRHYGTHLSYQERWVARCNGGWVFTYDDGQPPSPITKDKIFSTHENELYEHPGQHVSSSALNDIRYTVALPYSAELAEQLRLFTVQMAVLSQDIDLFFERLEEQTIAQDGASQA